MTGAELQIVRITMEPLYKWRGPKGFTPRPAEAIAGLEGAKAGAGEGGKVSSWVTHTEACFKTDPIQP